VSKIELDKQTQQTLARLVVRHLKDELEVEIEPFDGLALLDFLAQTLGPYYYNQGLHDAQAVARARVESIVEAVYEIEQPLKT
jgi:uncharacterized protein (DUF2164 family)